MEKKTILKIAITIIVILALLITAYFYMLLNNPQYITIPESTHEECIQKYLDSLPPPPEGKGYGLIPETIPECEKYKETNS